MSTTGWTNALGTGNWGTNGNWTASAPANGSEVQILATATAGDILLGLGQSGVYVNSIHIQPGFRGNIGASGTPLEIRANRIIHEGRGKLWFDSGVAATSDVLIAAGHHDAAWIDGYVTRLSVLKGVVDTGSSFATTDATQVFVGYIRNVAKDAKVTLNGSRVLRDVLVYGGTCEVTNSAAVEVRVHGGSYTHNDTGTLTRLYMSRGTTTCKGITTIGGAFVCGGTLDCSVDAELKTIQQLHLLPAATFLPNANTTVTAPTDGPLAGSIWGILAGLRP